MRILFITLPDSIHTARWITQFTDQGWEIHLVPATDAPLHPMLRNKVIYHGPKNEFLRKGRRLASKVLRRWPFHRGSGHAHRLIERLETDVSPAALAHIIRRVRPDIIHAMVIQHGGYLTLEAQRHFKSGFPPLIIGNWGSDIHLFRRLAAHKERIRQVLEIADFYTCECVRDVKLAQQSGFTGQVLPILPVGGGFDLEALHCRRLPGPTSRRRTILIKGYQTWAGRALVALQAVARCADLLRDYRVVVQLASPDVKLAAELIAYDTGIHIECGNYSDYAETMTRFGAARVHIGLGISDGISQSLLESMVMGTFPIQAGTACANEWIEDGRSGLIVPPEEPGRVAEALRRALTDDSFVDEAVALNDETVARRLPYEVVRQQAIKLYETVFAAGPLHPPAAQAGQ